MSKLTLSEALEIVPIGKTKLYQDAKNGIITTEKDYQGKKVVDVSELQRVYGKLRNPETDIERTEPNTNGQAENGTKQSSHQFAIVQNLEKQVSALETQLELATDREKALIAEKSKLLDLADRLQKQNEIWMLTKPKPKGSFLNYFRLRR